MRKSDRLLPNVFALSVATMLFLPSVANCQTTDHTNSGVYVGANYGVGIANKMKGYQWGTEEAESFDTTRPKNSQVFGLSLGYKFNDNIRAELAFNRFNKFKYKSKGGLDDVQNRHIDVYFNQKMSANALFTNLYFDIGQFNKFIPYITLGIGYSRNKAGDVNQTTVHDHGEVIEGVSNEGKSRNEFAYNLGVGFRYKLNNRVVLELINYKHYNLGKIATKFDKQNIRAIYKLKVHTINTGVAFLFN